MQILITNISDVIKDNIAWQKALSEDEIHRYTGMNTEKRKNEFLSGRYLLKKILKTNIIEIDSNGKPYIKNSDIKFNISHSKDMIAIVVDDKEVGIDIEYINQKRNLDSLIEVFDDEVVREYLNIPQDEKALYFYKNWTHKEAYMKLTQEGFIRKTPPDSKVHFKTFQPEQGYVVSIASYSKIISPQFLSRQHLQ